MEYWNHIYQHFDPIALNLGFISIHWYGIMYVLALFLALSFAKFIIKKDTMDIDDDILDNFFIWIEVGVILGARLGYILFYDTQTTYYLIHPWQIFNPFVNGEFVGIRGMSYHGAIIGALIASFLFGRRHPEVIMRLLDVVGLAVPVGYIFGRIGNFLNQELVGKVTDISWGIYVDGVMRHPSQLYEAVIEGVIVAMIIYLYRNHKRFEGELFALYGILYGVARFIAEFWRQPDPQIGYLCCGWLSMGQLMSLLMLLFSCGLYIVFQHRAKSSIN